MNEAMRSISARTFASAASWQLISQAIAMATQLSLAAITSRHYPQHVFGSFVGLLSLQAILTVVAVSGISSYVLRERNLSGAQFRLAIQFCVIISLGTGFAYLLLAPTWARLLSITPDYAMLDILAAAQIVVPFSALTQAVVRREAGSSADARITLTAAVASTGAGAISVVMIGSPWCLAAAPLAQQMVILAASTFVARRTRGGHIVAPQEGSSTQAIIHHAGQVAAQNLVFLSLAQVPTWVVSAVLGPASLAVLSRAGSVTTGVSTAIANALMRTTQPIWRKLPTAEFEASLIRTTSYSAILCAAVFGVIAGTSKPLVTLWLGSGWNVVAGLVPWLAAASYTQALYAIIANAAEMTGRFRQVRQSQAAMGAALSASLLAFAFMQDITVAAAALLVTNTAGLVVLTNRLFGLSQSMRVIGSTYAQLAMGAAAAATGLLAGGLSSTTLGSLVIASSSSLAVAGLGLWASIYGRRTAHADRPTP